MKYLFGLFLVLVSFCGFSQQNHFIYIQADNRQPFYVKLDKKILSSSVSGYLIIPKLQDSTYKLTVGFPKKEWPEQKLTCNINRADAGYLLKNFGEKGWALFNLQTMNLVMADTAANTDIAVVKEEKKDAFADMLSEVVNDPNLKRAQKPVADSVAVTTTEIKKATDKTIAKKTVKPSAKTKGKAAEPAGKTRIAKLYDKKNRDSIKLVYVDMVKGVADTVNVVIPVVRPVAKPIVVKKPVETVKDLARTNKKKIKAVTDSVNTVVPVKKIPVPVTDPGKLTVKNLPIIKDSVMHRQRADKKGKPIANLAKNDKINGHIMADTAMYIRPAKKAEVPVTDLVRADEKPLMDTAKALLPEIKKDSITVTEKPVETVVVEKKPDTVAVMEKPVETVVVEKKPDTVAVTEKPVETVVVEKKADTVALIEKPVEPVVIEKKPDTPVVREKPVETVVIQKKADTVAVIEKPVENLKQNNIVPSPVRVFAPCKEEASPDDFLGLKKKMDRAASDAEKLNYAHKAFVKRCFTTKQIERLSTVFDNDEGKYKLFDDAYQYVTDRENFAGLVAQLKELEVINRFNAMIR